MKSKTSDKVKLELDNELRRAYEVLKHLKKKVGANAFNEEYRIVVAEIKAALRLNKKSQADDENKREDDHDENDDAAEDEKNDEVLADI